MQDMRDEAFIEEVRRCDEWMQKHELNLDKTQKMLVYISALQRWHDGMVYTVVTKDNVAAMVSDTMDWGVEQQDSIDKLTDAVWENVRESIVDNLQEYDVLDIADVVTVIKECAEQESK